MIERNSSKETLKAERRRSRDRVANIGDISCLCGPKIYASWVRIYISKFGGYIFKWYSGNALTIYNI